MKISAHFLPVFLLHQNNLYPVILIKPCLLLELAINCLGLNWGSLAIINTITI